MVAINPLYEMDAISKSHLVNVAREIVFEAAALYPTPRQESGSLANDGRKSKEST